MNYLHPIKEKVDDIRVLLTRKNPKLPANLYGIITKDELSSLYHYVRGLSHVDWKLLKRATPTEIYKEDFFVKTFGNLHASLQMIKSKERERKNQHRYNYIVEAENIFKSVEERIQKQIKSRYKYDPEDKSITKKLVADLFPGFVAFNDLPESHLLEFLGIKESKINELTNTLIEKLDNIIDNVAEGRRDELTGPVMSLNFYTFFLLNLNNPVSMDRILYGHKSLVNKLKNRTDYCEKAVDYVLRLGKKPNENPRDLSEAHYQYVLYKLLDLYKQSDNSGKKSPLIV